VGLKDERDGKDFKDAARALFRIAEGRPICRIRHSITRYRILLEAYHAEATGEMGGVWKTIPQLTRLPFTSAHRKILAALHKKGPLHGERAFEDSSNLL
jgi:hypothetical protein